MKDREELYDSIAKLFIMFDKREIDYDYLVDRMYRMLAEHHKSTNAMGHCMMKPVNTAPMYGEIQNDNDWIKVD